MRAFTAALLGLSTFFGLSAGLMAQTGSITGNIADSSGPAAGASVTASLMSPVQPGTTAPGAPPTFMPFAANGMSDAKGQFEIDGLPAGTYNLCVEKRSAALLNPCIWSATPPRAVVTAGKTTSGVQISAATGVVVTVRVSDPQSLLAANPAKDDILIGTGYGKSPFIPAMVAERDGMGKTVSLVVPAGQAARISLYSTSFALADGNGNAFGSQAVSLPLSALQTAPAARVEPGSIPATPTLTVQVTGRATTAPAGVVQP